MLKINFSILLFLVLIIAVSCQMNSSINDPDLQKLKKWMTGSFSSHEQSVADTNFFDIHLEMAPIWEDREDAIWLYVEQAAAWKLEKPYRQRVYRLTKLDNGKIESAIFTINNPLQYTGAYTDIELLSKLSFDSIAEKEGCSLILDMMKDEFTGATEEDACPSKLYDSKYATSEVSIQQNLLKSLDRGYDSLGNQVWGSEFGAYIFKRSKIE